MSAAKHTPALERIRIALGYLDAKLPDPHLAANQLRQAVADHGDLIAAAPELLEAMQASVALADENRRRAEAEGRTVVRSPQLQAVYDRCVAAIAKATGSAP